MILSTNELKDKMASKIFQAVAEFGSKNLMVRIQDNAGFVDVSYGNLVRYTIEVAQHTPQDGPAIFRLMNKSVTSR